MKATAFPVAVIGSGPAGVATACGLRRLGHRVVLFGGSRNTSIEGVSERTLMRLHAAGLEAAAACVLGPGERTGLWGGVETAKSREYLIERSALDAALVKDAVAATVELRAEPVSALEACDAGWRIQTCAGAIESLVVVDARGRYARGAPLRGPRLVSVAQRFVRQSQESLSATARGSGPSSSLLRTAICPMADGWCWLADDGRGTRWVQVVGAPTSVQANADVPLRIAAALPAISTHASFLEGTVAIGAPVVRAAVAKMSLAATARGMLRVGDAAIAMDPLSGHGIHEALVSARAAVAAAHAYLEGSDWDAVAQLMNGRTRAVWERMTQAAAHFYGIQAAHSATPFWRQAASAYESLATAARFGEPRDPGYELPMPLALGG